MVVYFSFLSLLFFVTTVNFTASLKILQIGSAFSTSQVLVNYKLSGTLAEQGHNVTILSIITFNLRGSVTPPSGVKEIKFQILPTGEDAKQAYKAVKDMGFGRMSWWDFIKMLRDFHHVWMRACEKLLNSDDLLKEISEENFDLMLGHYFDLCPLQVAFLTKIPKTAWLSPATYIIDEVANYLMLPTMPSFIPNGISAFTDTMNFFERGSNFVLTTTIGIITKTSIQSLHIKQDKIFREFPNEDYPNMWQLISNVTGLFMNGEPMLDFPRPLFWSTSFMGTTGGREKNVDKKFAKKLSEKWKNVVGNWSGIIIFSFGSIVDTRLMPDSLTEMFLNSFSKFPDYKIIWRFEKTVSAEKVPPNVHISPWIPQQELLNHQKSKLFITHGGYNSLLEASRAGVPMLIIPLWGDQPTNAVRAVRYSLAIVLNKHKLSTEIIVDSIKRILTDQSYSKACKRLADIMDDKTEKSGKVLSQKVNLLVKAKWIPNPSAPQRLNSFQYYLVDVVLFLLFISGVTFFIICKLISQVFSMVQKNKKQK